MLIVKLLQERSEQGGNSEKSYSFFCGKDHGSCMFLRSQWFKGSAKYGRKWDTEYLHCLIPLDESQTKKEEKEQKQFLSGEHQEFVYLIQ